MYSITRQLPAYIIITLSMLMFEASSLNAQSIKHISIEGAFRVASERDFGFSPLKYNGVKVGGGLSYIKQKKTKTNLLSISFETGKLRNHFLTGMQVFSGNITAYTFYHSNKSAYNGLNWGWSNNNEFGLRNNEAITNFNNRNEYFTSFGPALSYRLPFKLFNRDFSFQTIANIQLLGFTLLSSYVTSSPLGFIQESQPVLKSFFSSINLFYPCNSINAGYKAGVQYKLKSENMFAINYEYNYLRLNAWHLLVKSRGRWSFSIIVRL